MKNIKISFLFSMLINKEDHWKNIPIIVIIHKLSIEINFLPLLQRSV